MIGSRGSKRTLMIGLAADGCCPPDLICMYIAPRTASFLGSSITTIVSSNNCVWYPTVNTFQLAHRRTPPGATRECFSGIFRVRYRAA